MGDIRYPGKDSPETRLALFDFAFENAPIGIAMVDLEGRIIRGNEAFARMTGRCLPKLLDLAFAEFTHPDDLAGDLALFDEVLAGKRDGYTIEKRYIQPGGDVVQVRIHVAAMRETNGRVARFISQIEDITREKKTEADLVERAAQLELAMEAIRGGFWHMDVSTLTFETSDRLAQFIGGPAAARLDLNDYLSRINTEDSPSADLTPLIAGQLDQSVAEYRLDTVAGQRWMRCDRRLLRDEHGKPRLIVGVAIDFTDEHRRLEGLERSAETDALTGLLNRRGLDHRFQRFGIDDGYSVIVVDLDGFKEVNDENGHAAGDEVLVETGSRLQGSVRDGDLVSRTGGDEFLLVVRGLRRAGELVADRIVGEMARPFTVEGRKLRVSASVGGASGPRSATTRQHDQASRPGTLRRKG
jgi:diguanylate cyclase (GGDEF)-like protein/PAS domain S-box-containing protein